MSSNTKFIDLDAVSPETEIVVRLGGNEHKLVPISVEDFVANTKAIAEFAKKEEKSIEDEINLTVGMLLRAFPSMTRELLHKLNLNQLNKLVEFAHSNNGQKKVEEEAKAAAENPPTAGQ